MRLKRKIKLIGDIHQINVKIITILGAIAVAIVFFFAVIFALAASLQATLTRLVTSGILFVIGIAIIIGIYYATRKPKTIIQRVEISGQMKAISIKCPNCSAPIGENRIKIVSSVPYATCPYCGNTFEVSEEPKW